MAATYFSNKGKFISCPYTVLMCVFVRARSISLTQEVI